MQHRNPRRATAPGYAVALIAAALSCSPSSAIGSGAKASLALTSASEANIRTHERAAAEAHLGVALPSRPGLRVAVFAPHRAVYDSSLGGPRELSVDLLLTNTTGAPMNVTDPRVGFASHRNGVEYACSDERPGEPRVGAPVWLGPGASLALARTLDCVIPVLGSYAVDVFVGFGPGALDVAHRERDLAGRASVQVVGTGAALPRRHPSQKGLEIALVSDTAASVPGEAGNGYHVTAVFVNTGAAPLRLGPMRVSLRVFSRKHLLSCAAEPFDVARPTTIDPGHVHRVSVPVTCTLEPKGQYEITAFVGFVEDPVPVEMGQLELVVAADSALERFFRRHH